MELVYLWVEDYKNIHKQGFNFSPRFECKFHDEYDEKGNLKDDCKLEIKPKEHIENFFGDNINVTAIVGKNGSGKSSILNAIVNANEDIVSNLLVFLGEDDKLYYKYDKDISTTIKKYESSLNNFVIYIDRVNEDSPVINGEATSLSSDEDFMHAMIHYNKIDISKKSIINLLAVEIGTVSDSFEISTFMYIPNKISIKLKLPDKLIGSHIAFIASARQITEDYFMSLSDIEHQLLIIQYLRQFGIKSKIDTMKDKKLIKAEIGKDDSDKVNIVSQLYLKPKENIDISSLTEEDKNLYIRKGGFSHLLDFDLIDKEGRKYNDLSHGEQKIFGQLLNIYFYAQRKHLLFLFDEPEIALHPDWQKRYMNEVIMLLKKMEGKNHFILTSHSPFLLSDIPKQNIIFLDKDKDGKCKVVDGLKDKKQTFGANIHTLLSDSFFMEDGLMGEFAKGKINEIIEFFDNKNELYSKNKERLYQIINTIGEPFLKEKLLFMYSERFPKTKEEQIADYQAKIERLKSDDKD